jgi:PAS domain S-box-containing protein
LRTLVGAISDVALVLDRDGRYLDVLSQRGELLVKPATELIGRSIHDMFPPETAEIFVRWIREALDTGCPIAEDYEVDIGGRHTSFAAVVAPLKPGMVVWIARDITEHKALEAQLRHAAKMEAIGQLAGGVAHDFNNLLTAITTNAELALGAQSTGEDVQEELGQIKRAAERAAGLTRQLLAFSRKQMLQPRVMRVNEAVREAGELLARVIGEDIHLITCLDQDTWPVVADTGQLTQVVLNLAVNARDAMPNGGTLTITAGNLEVTDALAVRQPGLTAGPYVVLTVRDTGCGMDRRTQERIFEPFFTTKEQGRGTGLGLATVYGIVRQSGGCIQLASEVGRGSTFWIFLPRSTEPAAPPAQPAPTPAAEVPKGTTVLIVEDEAQVRGALARVLRRYEVSVIESPNGLDAVSIWETRRAEIALVVTDVVMPHLGGRELVRRLRADGATVPVLFMSGYAEGAAPERYDDTGRSAFLAKPFDIAVFVRLVGELINGANRQA